MQTGFLHLHVTVVIIFLLQYAFKVILLLTNQSELLDKVRAKTKIADMVLGTLILVTGGYLLVQMGHPPLWLTVKTVMVLALIPLGIVGMRKGNKVLSGIVLLTFIYVYGIAETRSLTFSKPDYTQVNGTQKLDEVAAVIYTNECVRCHGEDGNAQQYGAKKLSESALSVDERVAILTAGKGTMPAFGGKLTNEQIKAVAAYVDKFKK